MTGAHGPLRAAKGWVVITDSGIELPTGFIVLSIADTGTIEFHVLFQRG